MVTLALSTWIPGLQPPHEGDSANWIQNLALYGSLYIVALGTGGIKPNVSAFGADQFDMSNPQVSPRSHDWTLNVTIKLLQYSTGKALGGRNAWEWAVSVLPTSPTLCVHTHTHTPQIAKRAQTPCAQTPNMHRHQTCFLRWLSGSADGKHHPACRTRLHIGVPALTVLFQSGVFVPLAVIVMEGNVFSSTFVPRCGHIALVRTADRPVPVWLWLQHVTSS